MEINLVQINIQNNLNCKQNLLLITGLIGN